jgi:formylglycine-generating enzyme
MALKREKAKQIYDAFLDGYDEFTLRQMVFFGMGESLNEIAQGNNLREQIFSLIEWASRTGREQELVQMSYEHNPINPLLKTLYDTWFPTEPHAEFPSEPDADIASPLVRHLHPSPTSTQVSVPSLYSKSWALVIGINDYGSQFPRLFNARNDAAAMADLLQKEYEFDHVITLYDTEATYSAIVEWLRDRLPKQVDANDRLVIFFAGHGTTRTSMSGRMRGYLIPQDAKAEQYHTYIDMTEVSDACGFIRAKHIFLILDCCFSGVVAVARAVSPPASPESITNAYLREITQRPAWQVLTAGAEDQLAADSGSRPGHSAFTGAVLSGLEGGADQNADGIITASELAGFVRPEVIHETRARGGVGQTPYFNYLTGSGQGDFVFVLPARMESGQAGPSIEFDWVMIPAGEFWMGSTKTKDKFSWDNETPQHKIRLPEYRIARVPVTVAQFAAFVEATGYRTNAEEVGWSYVWIGAKWEQVDGAYWARPKGPQSSVERKQDHPVTCISWQDAVAFCQWAGVRLPTEAEWEKAARGTDGRIWPWGGSKPTAQRCNFAEQVGDTTPVGYYPDGASPYGVLDMAGNVLEWTSSKYLPYPYDAQDGREDAEGDDYRTLRGGAWRHPVNWVRCAIRHGVNPHVRYDDYGFRVVVSPGS